LLCVIAQGNKAIKMGAQQQGEPMPYPHLLSPLKVEPKIVRNRVLVTAHVPGLAGGGVPRDRCIAYHRKNEVGYDTISPRLFDLSVDIRIAHGPSHWIITLTRPDPHAERFMRYWTSGSAKSYSSRAARSAGSTLLTR
jgi:hypothetical protein